VLGPSGDAIAALSISGPTARLTSERIVQLAPLLIDEATQLARRLGHRDHARGAA
jgi:DNA-binding IclR family transcriptional regulator